MVVVTVTVRNLPKFRFGVQLVLAGSVRFGKNFAEFFSIQSHVHLHLQYMGIKRTDYAILCNKYIKYYSFLSHSTMPQYISRQLRFTL